MHDFTAVGVAVETLLAMALACGIDPVRIEVVVAVSDGVSVPDRVVLLTLADVDDSGVEHKPAAFPSVTELKTTGSPLVKVTVTLASVPTFAGVHVRRLQSQSLYETITQSTYSTISVLASHPELATLNSPAPPSPRWRPFSKVL